MNPRGILLALTLAGSLRAAETAMDFPKPESVHLAGLIGTALAASEHGRLSHFVVDENSPAIQLFSAEGRKGNTTGRYWGEHAGKWLYAAARGANRTGDPVLAAHVKRGGRLPREPAGARRLPWHLSRKTALHPCP